MKKIIVISGLVLLTLCAACTRFAAMKGPFDGETVNPAFVQYIGDKAEDQLALTEDQRIEFDAIVNKAMRKALEQRSHAKALKVQAAEIVRAEALDMGGLEALLRKRMDLMKIVLDSVKGDLKAFHATLSAVQREKLAKLLLEHGSKGWHGAH
jgi:uncharacterized membrane protein